MKTGEWKQGMTDGEWQRLETIGYESALADQISALRTRWPQAWYERPKDGRHGEHLIFLPGFLLPKGYNKTICTVLFLARISGPCYTHDGGTVGNPVTEFWVDLPDLLLASGKAPKRSYDCTGQYFQEACCPKHGCRAGIWDGIPGFSQWRDVRLFLWRQQHFNPNKETLFTSAMVIRQRLMLAI
jgi:hypothetical protein